MNNNLPTLSDRDARSWAMFCHLLGFLFFCGVPLGNVFGPLVVWMIRGKDSPFVDDQGREAVNFGITMNIVYLVLLIALISWIGIPIVMVALNQGLVAVWALVVGTLSSLLVFFVVFPLVHILLIVVGAVRAANGAYHRYPFTIRFIR